MGRPKKLAAKQIKDLIADNKGLQQQVIAMRTTCQGVFEKHREVLKENERLKHQLREIQLELRDLKDQPWPIETIHEGSEEDEDGTIEPSCSEETIEYDEHQISNQEWIEKYLTCICN